MSSDCIFSKTWANAFVMIPLLSCNEFKHFNREKLPHNIIVQELPYHFACHLRIEQCFGCVDAYAESFFFFFLLRKGFKLVKQLVILNTGYPEIQAAPSN